MWHWLDDNLEEALCAGMLLFMATLAFVNVLVRYFTNFSFAFTEEIEVNLLVYLTMLGTAAGFKRGLHLSLVFLATRFPRTAQRCLQVAAALLGSSLFLALFWFGVRQIRDEIALGTTSEALAIPQWWYTLGLPLGALFVVARIIQAACRDLRRASDA